MRLGPPKGRPGRHPQLGSPDAVQDCSFSRVPLQQTVSCEAAQSMPLLLATCHQCGTATNWWATSAAV